MNFSVIGGNGGGGGGPVATGGAVATGVGCIDGGGAGGAFGLNRNRFRSASDGAGRSPSNASRCTSGAVGVGGLRA